jgi:UDP-glucose 6-dehydrogenase
MQIQELYGACEAAGVDFYTIRDAVYGDDPRFDLWWTFVYPSNRAADSKCLPKDIHAWASWASNNGADASATKALLEFNDGLKSKSQKK